jgi:isopentenyl-diphosphate delta-isomerase
VEPVPNAEEVMDTIWHPLEDLAEEVARRPSGFTPWLQIYLRDHARSIFGTMPA